MTTITQRKRNVDFYHRLKDGDPTRPGLRGSPLHRFSFVIPCEDVAYWPDGKLSFLLAPDSECYHRLLSAICDALPESCDADEKLDRVRQWASDSSPAGAKNSDDYREAMNDVLALLKE